MKQIKAVICDIDGTIRQKGNLTLSEATKDVLSRLHKQGVLLGLASGRSIERELIYCAEKWGMDFQFDLLIGENGAEYYDLTEDKIRGLFVLKREWIKEIIEMMSQFNLNPSIYSHQDKLVMFADTSTLSMNPTVSVYKIIEDISEFWAQEAKKVMYKVKTEQFDAVKKYIEDHPNKNYKGIVTNIAPTFATIEFVETHVNKAVPIVEYCHRHQYDIEEVMAFGDTTNDNEMLQACGVGVCLLDGTDDTKAVADAITEFSNEEDGFAKYVIHHVLEPRGW
ncbi:MAG: HAD-IIB family hydrolase [Erysipelotrichaceae bacterium]|nr:HAD-IIB family hydrolase [Erysipelotrichaceae bacterium]